jgi:glycosyltransferase involved in cell wall biosynthesis
VKKCDTLIAWRNAPLLELPIEAKQRLLWVHDVFAMGATNKNLLRADAILGLSEWHRQFLIEKHQVSPAHVVKTRNGINLSRFDQVVPRDPHKIVYSSSPDRGLPALLDMWPRIRAQVPDATLHIFYGFFNWRKMAEARGDTAQVEYIAGFEARIKQMSDQGVVFRDRVDQMELAREFLSAGVWAYPTWFSETSCITAMEAQAAGLRIVTSPIAALNETVGERGVLIPGDWLSSEYQAKFVEATVKALTYPEGSPGVFNDTRGSLMAYARASFGWDTLAKEWEGMMRAASTATLLPYQPRKEFERCA